jgi:hypothetical protein
VIDFPLGDILRKQYARLAALNIDFSPCKAIKSQVLMDFIAEWIELQQPELEAILNH